LLPTLDVLVVDDEPDILSGIADALGEEGHQVTKAADGASALKLISERVFDVVFCDVRLPKIDGLTLLRHLHKDSPSTVVVLMTAFGRVADAIAALREGAYDYVTKPFAAKDFPVGVINRIVEELTIEQVRQEARNHLDSRGGNLQIVGRSPAMVRLFAQLDTVAQSDAPVLLSGESGTGKELIAQALHDRSRRRKKPYVTVNCAALPEALLEAELFGHERGAFTGAVKDRDGRFKMADGGTLLLDEIAEVSLSAQSKLLRVLQEGTIERLGSNVPIKVDVRIISATHQDLKTRVADGRFREDLYYRLNVLDLKVPPLRDRRGDLPLLLEYFLRRFVPEGQEIPKVSQRAWQMISRYYFPGNIREFAHAVERAVVLSRGRRIDLEHLPPDVVGDVPQLSSKVTDFRPLATTVREFERGQLLQALSLAAGKRGRAADLLGVSRKTLWEKLRSHGIVDSEVDDITDPGIPPDVS
jgi:DNA-binding NtrC family response regulator